jgi:hypothetical protein
MIRCIQVGGPNGPIMQGDLLRQWAEPRRHAPAFSPEAERRAAVMVHGETHVGRLIEHSQGPVLKSPAPTTPAVAARAAGGL